MHRTAVVLLLVAAAGAQDEVPLRLSADAHSATVASLPDGVQEVRCAGGDPYVFCEPLAGPFDATRLHVIAFEYRCPAPQAFEVFFGPPIAGGRSARSAPQPAAADWRAVAIDLLTVRDGDWSDRVRLFRLDFSDGDHLVRVRNLVLRAPTAAEERAAEAAREAAARAQRERAERVERTLIAPARVPDLGDSLAATHRYEAAGAVTAVAVVGRELDLATQLRDHARVQPPVPLGPALVVGEGAAPGNHTLVRVLNRYGIPEVQFLAFPPEVRGGVQVVAARTGPEVRVVAAPLTAAVRFVRVFSRFGALLDEVALPADLPAPVALTGGRLVPGAADGLALAPATVSGPDVPVHLVDLAGQPLRKLAVSLPGPAGRVLLSTLRGAGGDRVVVAVAGRAGLRILDPVTGQVEARPGALEPTAWGLWETADGGLAATASDPERSHLLRLSAAGTLRPVAVDARERLFYQTTAAVPETAFVKRSAFAHIRCDFASPAAREPDFARTDEAYWAGPRFQEFVDQRLRAYDTGPPTCWEPCFTHRWFAGQAQRWAAAKDPETGLPAYTLVDRDNQAGSYGEFGATNAFVSGTYAPGVAPLACFYDYPLRAFLRGLAVRHRANPEHFVAVEPNHEMEINAESPTTHGDYNPAMLRAFYRYLAALYGGLEGLNRTFGTAFTASRFDAPRDLGRGPWDRYAVDNPYYLVWMRFLNQCIYRIVAGTWREALLAGFPPEAIKCHQIPDHYAIASLTQFSKPAQRITPIDWNLTAGVGYGFTRYGVWYREPHNPVQGAHSSGQDQMVIGEYQSLTADVEQAYQQLRYLRDHGVQFIHCMTWPASHDRGYNAALTAALRKLAAEDQPRPTHAGGTGQLRVWRDGDQAVELVSLGTGAGHPGLIKSVRADGSWSGAVYVVPFHAQVAVTPLSVPGEVELTSPLSLGPFERVGAGHVLDLGARAVALAAAGALTLRVYHGDVELPGCRLAVPVTRNGLALRLLVRVQMDTDRLRITLDGPVRLTGLQATLQAEQTTRLKQGVLAGERHAGGVTFDVLGD